MPKDPNELIPCPSCGNKAFNRPFCLYCDKGGLLPRWVVETITTDGQVR